MGFIAIWLFCGMACATIAASKRRGAVAWFVLGVVFGPFALLAAIGVSKGGVPCPACRMPIDPAASICPHCRTPRFKPTRAVPPAAVSASVEPRACQACMAPVNPSAVFCPQCGTQVRR